MSGHPTPIGRIVAPLVSTNEPESQVVDLCVEGYSKVSRGDVVCVLETSKSTVEVESEYEGYTGEIEVRLNDRVTAGQLICEVFDGVPERPSKERSANSDRTSGDMPAGLKLTRKAEKLALETGIDLSILPTGRFLTERDVEALIAGSQDEVELDESIISAIHEQAVVVFGAGGFAKSLIDLMRSSGAYEAICVVDDDPEAASEVLGVPVLGGRQFLAPLREHGLTYAVNAVGAVGLLQTRIDIVELLQGLRFELPTLIDPKAFVAESATLSEGVQVFAGAAVCSASAVGRAVIINTGAIVSHDCRIGDFTHIAPGAILAGEVEVGDSVLVGMGVTANIGIRVGARAIIGNGCVLHKDVPEGTIVPAASVWPR